MAVEWLVVISHVIQSCQQYQLPKTRDLATL